MRNSMIFLVFLMLCTFSLQAQPVSRPNAEKMLKAAEQSMANNDPYTALDWYQELYKENKDRDVGYIIAQLHYQLRDFARAERAYARIVNRKYRKGANPYLPQARFDYARILKMNGNYPEALQHFQLYISESEDLEQIKLAKVEVAGIAMAQEMDPISGMAIENAGPNINTRYSEYSPVLVGDNEMFFSAIQSKKVIVLDGKEGDYYSKLFTSTRQGDGWTEAQISGGTNIHRAGYHIGNITISADGKLLYFTRARLSGNKLNESKLYVSQRSSDGWGPAAELKGINGDYIVKQPTLGELYNKEVLIFTSDMTGGYGGFDLYYSTRNADGTYSTPTNLGAVVNTGGDEESAYYLDGKLYFSSTGHPGIGGFDIFSSDWDGSTWSAPENLGTPFNSSVDDLYFSIDKDGYSGLLVSNRPGTNSVKSKTCCNDIYTITKQNLVLDLLANTLTTEGKPLTGVQVELIIMEKDVPGITDNRNKENDNKYTFNLARETAYMLVGTKESYLPDTLTFNTVGVRKSTEYKKELKLKFIPPPPKEPEYVTITTEEPIRLNNI